MRSTLVGLCLLALVNDAQAQTVQPWVVRGESGIASIHKFVDEPRGAIAAIRFARVWADDIIRFDVGVAGSNADAGAFMADFGVELRLCPATCRVVPFAGAFVGTLVEPVYKYSGMSRAGGGVEVRLAANHAVRLSAYAGRHDRDARGPHVISIGYSRRFRR